MPSFRITSSEELEERAKIFKASLIESGILKKFKDALIALREKFMEGALPADPMVFVMDHIGVPRCDKGKIKDLEKEFADIHAKLLKYDDKLKQICLEVEQKDGSFEEPQNAIEIFHSTPRNRNECTEFSVDEGTAIECSLSKLDLTDSDGVGTSNEFGNVSVGNSVGTRPKFRVPGGPMVESKREECRKTLEKLGILISLERALTALLILNVFPENAMDMMLNNLRIHSLEYQDVRALKNMISIMQKRLEEIKNDKKMEVETPEKVNTILQKL